MVCILVLVLCIWVYNSITTLYIANIGMYLYAAANLCPMH